MVPVMKGCVEQWKVNVPALVNVNVKLWSLERLPLSNSAVSLITVWFAGSRLVHVTFAPALTVRLFGVKAKF